jgi:hypothetical protein
MLKANNLKGFMKENYDELMNMRFVQDVRLEAKKEVINDVQEYLDEVDKQIPWQLILSHGCSLKNIKPSWNDIKKKHIGENKNG